MGLTDHARERMAAGLKATLVSRLLFMLSTAALMIALTRYLLTPDGYGRLSFALAVLGTLQLFAGLGVAKSGARYVTQYLEEDPAQVRYVVTTAIAVMAVAVVVIATGLLLWHGALAALLGEPSLGPLLLVGAGYIATYPFAIAVRLLFNAYNRITYSAVVRAVDGVSRLAFGVGFVLLGLGAAGALLGYVAGFVVAAVLGGVLFWRGFAGSVPDGDVEPGLRRRVLGYGVPLTVTWAADVLDSRVDAIIVGVLLGPVPVGFYTLAKQISDFTIVPAMSVDTTIAPRLGERKASGDLPTAARIYESALEHVLLAYVAAGAGLVLVAEPAVRYVFGASYLGAVPVLQVFGVYVLVRAVNALTANGLDYLGRGRDRAILNGGTSIANAGLTLALVPTMGVVGAAVATVLTSSVYTAGNVVVLHQEVGLDLRRLAGTAGGVVGVAGAMALVVLVATPYVSGLASLVGVIALGAGVWGVLATTTGLLDLALVREVLA